ncbi:MAG: hypothetical protein AAF680_05890 [Pseudomonadota bacterium]
MRIRTVCSAYCTEGERSDFLELAGLMQCFRSLALAMLALLSFSGCGSEPVQPLVEADPVNMEGNWELDYGRSDNLQARFNANLRSIRQQSARANAERRPGAAVAGSASQQRLLALAQMAELVTESQLLTIEQSRVAVRVKREGNFSLSCDFGPDAPGLNDLGLGVERCFWDGNQLVFHLRLPDGLNIIHRLSMSQSGDTLGVLTSLDSPGVGDPFTVRRIYRRYVPGSSGYRCTETLTRGRVCTTEKASK